MTKQPRRDVDDSRDDADARGEHVYGLDRSGRKVPAESQESVRQPGHYAAGADGTQDVAGADKTESGAEPKDEQSALQPSSSSRGRRPRKIR
jgi:hypothetical protein